MRIFVPKRFLRLPTIWKIPKKPLFWRFLMLFAFFNPYWCGGGGKTSPFSYFCDSPKKINLKNPLLKWLSHHSLQKQGEMRIFVPKRFLRLPTICSRKSLKKLLWEKFKNAISPKLHFWRKESQNCTSNLKIAHLKRKIFIITILKGKI